LQAGSSSRHPTNSVTALEETQSPEYSQKNQPLVSSFFETPGGSDVMLPIWTESSKMIQQNLNIHYLMSGNHNKKKQIE